MSIFKMSRAVFEKTARILKQASPDAERGPHVGQRVAIFGDSFDVAVVTSEFVSMKAVPNTPLARKLARDPSAFEYRGSFAYGAQSVSI